MNSRNDQVSLLQRLRLAFAIGLLSLMVGLLNPAKADDLDIYTNQNLLPSQAPLTVLVLDLNLLNLNSLVCRNVLLSYEADCIALRKLLTFQQLFNILGVPFPVLAGLDPLGLLGDLGNTTLSIIDTAPPLVSVVLNNVVGVLVGTISATLGSVMGPLNPLDLANNPALALFAALQAVLQPLINSRVGIMLFHGNQGPQNGPCAFADQASLAGERQTTAGCSNGAYFFLGLINLTNVTDILTRLVPQVLGIASNLLNGGATAGAVFSGGPYQTKEAYSELARYLRGDRIYNAPLNANDNRVLGVLPRDTSLETTDSSGYKAYRGALVNYPQACSINMLHLQLTAPTSQDDSDADLLRLFPLADQNGDGRLSLPEVVDSAAVDGFVFGGNNSDRRRINSYFLVQDSVGNLSDLTALQNLGYNVTTYTNLLGLMERGLDIAGTVVTRVLSIDASLTSPSIAASRISATGVADRAYLSEFRPDPNRKPDWPGNLKRLQIRADSNGQLQYYDASNRLAFASDGRLYNSALTFWTRADQLGGRSADGRNTTLGGAGQNIPGYQFGGGGSPGRGNPTAATDNSKRRLFYDSYSGTSGPSLAALNPDDAAVRAELATATQASAYNSPADACNSSCNNNAGSCSTACANNQTSCTNNCSSGQASCSSSCSTTQTSCASSANGNKTTCIATADTALTSCQTVNNPTVCQTAATNAQTACNTTANTNKTSCTNSANTTQTTCNTSATNTQTSCNATASGNQSSCNTSVNNTYNSCAASATTTRNLCTLPHDTALTTCQTNAGLARTLCNTGCLGNSSCINACTTTYNNSMAACTTTYNNNTASCNANYNGSIAACTATRDSGLATCTSNYNAATTTCTNNYNSAVASCSSTHNNSITSCNDSFSTAVASCTSTYNTSIANCTAAYNNCTTTHTNAVNQCNTTYNNAIDQCNSNYSSCTSTCSTNASNCSTACSSTRNSCDATCSSTQNSCLIGCSGGSSRTVDTVTRELLLYARGYNVGTQAAPKGTGPSTSPTNTGVSARSWMMGAVLHSRPLAINYGRHGSSGVEDNLRVVFGSADGYLRMVRDDDGSESWAFMPQSVMPSLKVLRENAAGSTQPYGVDGSPTVLIRDRAPTTGSNTGKLGVIGDSSEDRVLLFFGLRRGGSYYYALNITDPDNPQFLWRLGPDGLYRAGTTSAASGSAAQYAELGLSFSTPQLGRMRIDTDGNLLTTNDVATKSVLIFGGGYNGGSNSAGARLGKDLNNSRNAVAADRIGKDDGSASGGRGNGIYIVDAETGALIWRANRANSAGYSSGSLSYGHPLLVDSIPSEVTALDTDNDNLIDRLYVGDTGGRLWRADFPSADRSAWTLTPLASIGRHAESTPTLANDRRIFFAPDYVPIRNREKVYDIILFGSGDREDPLNVTTQNWFYAYRDTDTVSGKTSSEIITSESALARHNAFADRTTACAGAGTSSGSCQDISGLDPGYKIALSQTGEKLFSAPLGLGGAAAFTTYVPSQPNAAICVPLEGSGRLYNIDLRNSRPRLYVNQVGSDRASTLATPGLPGEVGAISGPTQGASSTLIQQTTQTKWRASWRERLGEEEKPLP